VRARRIPLIVGVVVVVVTTALSGSASSTIARRSAAAAPLNRYSLVHGCYALRSAARGKPIASALGPFRMQAAALGVYLLYTPAGEYLSDAGGGALGAQSAPSAAGEWRVNGSARRGFTVTNAATGSRFPVRFAPATGCAPYPEALVDAAGPAFTAASPEADVLGTVEGHAHVTAFELFGGDWHCGTPWSQFGAPYALPASCARYQQGTNGQVEVFLDFGGSPRPSDMHGWPTFNEWPSPTAVAEEGDYYTGIERAWKAGLRVMVTNLVDNEALCGLMTTRHNPCNDMASVHIQSHDLYALQNYIDAQSGGPGKGWFRVVTDPFQARRVISQGKLAVIEGVEVSRIFGCGEMNDVPQCGPAQVDAGLKEVERLGVRTFFPVHEFDNAFGGTKMIAGATGTIINAGNRTETGSFWTLEPCPAQDQDAEQLSTPASGPLAGLINGPLSSMLHGSPVPVYGSGPQCNTRGLTGLGAYLIQRMIKQHLLIQLDHMDSKTATAALAIAEANHYSGVVSAHCCSSAQLFKRVYGVGGFITPPVEPSAAFVATWKSDMAVRAPGYHVGFGWGSDENGLADQPGPSNTPIGYPFKSYDGRVTFTREQWGQRTFDLNTDGLANYGMYADWLRSLQLTGGTSLMANMFQGAEAYLETWERADGVPAARCRPADEHFTSSGLGRSLRLGASSTTTLYRAGQPLARPGRAYRYCVGGARRGAALAAVFNRRGRLAMITTTAPGDAAGTVATGDQAARLHGRARPLTRGVWVAQGPGTGARYLYGVRSGRVRFVALTTAAELRSATRLHADLHAAGL
jgi:hypothetical protein